MEVYSWNKDYYDKKFNASMSAIRQKLDDSGVALENFFEWFETTYPETYKKYLAACDNISKLYKDNTPCGIEGFKSAVKTEMEACEFAVEKYIKFKDCPQPAEQFVLQIVENARQ